MKVLVQDIMMQYEFEVGLDIDLFDVSFSKGGRDRQPVFYNPDIQLLGKAGHEIKSRMDFKFEYHGAELK
jgi:hypothetical protein